MWDTALNTAGYVLEVNKQAIAMFGWLGAAYAGIAAMSLGILLMIEKEEKES